jgi:hypothetical protein
VPPVVLSLRRHNVQVTCSRFVGDVGSGWGYGAEDGRHGPRRWAGDDGQQRAGSAKSLEEQRTGTAKPLEEQRTGTTVALEVAAIAK